MEDILNLNLSSENKCRLRTWWEQIFKPAYAQGAYFIIMLFEFEHYYLEFWKYVKLLLLPLCKWTTPDKFYVCKNPIWVWPVFENIKTEGHWVCVHMNTFSLSDIDEIFTTQGHWFPVLPVSVHSVLSTQLYCCIFVLLFFIEHFFRIEYWWKLSPIHICPLFHVRIRFLEKYTFNNF